MQDVQYAQKQACIFVQHFLIKRVAISVRMMYNDINNKERAK
jgi:hypothetical protein